MSRAREEFIHLMATDVAMPLADARAIMRAAATVQRLAAEGCDRELSPVEVKRGGVAEERIQRLCAPYKVVADCNGDPRGCVVKLIVPSGRSNSLGGVGICVPGPRS